MRILSPAAEAMIQQETRVESVLLVTIHWNGGAGITYSDREFANLGFVGKLITIGQFDDVINIDSASNSNATSVTLDDVDGTLKSLMNTTDITKTKVEIYQWFVDLPITEKFSLFIGEITSPISWNEGDRTLTFNVQTRLLDIEAGFSIEEGIFPLAPASAIGKSWPLVFGTVGGVPALRFLDAPNGILGEGLGAVNEPAWAKELNDLAIQFSKANQNRIDAYALGVGAALKAAELGWPETDNNGDGIADISGLPTAPAEQAHDQSVQYYSQSEQYALDAAKISSEITIRKIEKAQQEAYNKTTFRVITQTIPQNIPVQIKVGPLVYTGTFNGEYFHATERDLPTYVRDINGHGKTVFNSIDSVSKVSSIFLSKKNNIEDDQKFWWLDAGTELKLINLPITYVATLGWPTITSVYGMRKGVRFRIPPSYYQIVQAQQDDNLGNFDTLLKVTYLIFSRPLSSIVELDGSTWDSDEIEFDAISEVGPNVVDIMSYLIQTFTEFTTDTDTFTHVRALVDRYPANFALTSRKNIVQLLKEIAFQARCSIWINDNVFMLRYLPESPTPVDTITEEDVTQNTLSIESSPTDRMITKFVAEWKALYNQRDFYKIIYKYNTKKYGINEETYNFYIYNASDLVEVAAQFWLIRKANNFKIVKFKTAINKLKLETLDPVTIDLPEVANVPVIGIVQKATYDEHNYTIEFEVWVPVRFGEMVPDIFAYPKDLAASHVYPLLIDPNIKTKNPFENQFIPIPHLLFAQFQPKINGQRAQSGSMNSGRHQPIADIHDASSNSPAVSIVLDPRDVLNTRPLTLETSNDKTVYNVKPLVTIALPLATPGVFPGSIVSQELDQVYNVDVFLDGIAKPSKRIKVTQFQIADDDVIPVGTPVMVSRIPKSTGGADFVMQAPTYSDNLT